RHNLSEEARASVPDRTLRLRFRREARLQDRVMPAKPERAQQPRAGQAARRKAIKILLSAAPKASALEVTLKPHFPKEVAQRHPAIRARLDKVPEALLDPKAWGGNKTSGKHKRL